MKIKFTYLLFLWLLTSSGLLKSQMAVLASGGDATGTGSSSYSIGQIDYLHKGANAEVMEGVQVAFEITTLSVNESDTNENGILLYPNPFRDLLYLDFTSNSYRDSNYQLFDAQGKLIRQDKITQSKSELNFSDLPSAMYIIKINQEGRDIKIFKIIKK
ncbi:T9SS type A sorting domain-containing protein [uncultured Chryseobacterium sp.]|uniref:T9SS type A sorting domain-containing protein n=1 Tax=uncultured Chryseobacterium sp. TaxID=259322 RepID=UPI002626AF29|nr:T9SS type A sorting domain-containing protein [uncultured Chryseobacterium sp.]